MSDTNTGIFTYLKTLYSVVSNADLNTLTLRYIEGSVNATKTFLDLVAASVAAGNVPSGYDIIFTSGDSNKFFGASFDGGLDVGDTNLKQLGYTAPNSNVVLAAVDPLDYAVEGVTASKIGHDVHFALDYYMANGLRLGSRVVLIVTNAKGGSSSAVDNGSNWGALTGTPGTPTTSSSSLLDVASGRRTTALALSGTNTVVVHLDCEGVNVYSAYGNTTQLGVMGKYRWQYQRKIQLLRNLLGATVPIVVTRQTKDAINAAGGVYAKNGVLCDRIIKSIARRFPYVGVSNSQSPTELGGDGVSGEVHFTAAEQRTLAARAYTAFLAAQSNTSRGSVTWEFDDITLSADGNPAGYTLTNSNLDLSGDANSGWKTALISAPVRSGKVYIEVKIQAMASGVNLGYLGFCNADKYLNDVYLGQTSSNDGPADMSAGQWGGFGDNAVVGYTKDWTGNASWTTNDIVMLAVDMTAGKAWIGKNGTWYNSGDPVAGTGQWISGIVDPIYLAASIYTGTGNTYRLQPSASSFTYTVPSGFSAWGA